VISVGLQLMRLALPFPGCALNLGPMTTREKAHKLLDELPESEIEPDR